MNTISKPKTNQVKWYQNRISIPDDKISFNTPFPGYKPQKYTAQTVIENDNTVKPWGWADPEDISKIDFSKRISFKWKIDFDEKWRPLNPTWRTWICGRGLLGKWWPNFAADPLIIRNKPWFKWIYQIITIFRKDNWKLALPWWMIDEWEDVKMAVSRELEEEAWVKVSMEDSVILYSWIVDDYRNTDNSWIEVAVAWKFLSKEIVDQIKFTHQESEVMSVQWTDLKAEYVKDMLVFSMNTKLIEKIRNIIPIS